MLLLLLGSAAVLAFRLGVGPSDIGLASLEGRAVRFEDRVVVRSGDPVAIAEVAGVSFPAGETVFELLLPPNYRTVRVMTLHLGPGEKYLGIGQVNRGGRVEVVGRNEKGDWLAVSLTPGAAQYAWIRADGIDSVIDPAALRVAPVKPLP